MKNKILILMLMGGASLFSEEIKEVDIGESVVNAKISANGELQKYQSGEALNRKMLDSNPSGNGDITSILRILPNVQYDITQQRSATPGEIDPAKISISGGLHYQNLFMIDGMGMNNDINPVGTANVYGGAPGRSQGFNIDTSLLESLKMQDSNVSAAYGGFTGGVVEANTRRPSKKFGANISYQIAQGNANPNAFSLTNYHIYRANESSLENFLNSSSESNQPEFIKHFVRASLESKISNRFGVLASFVSKTSIIPIKRHLGTSSSRPSPLDPAGYATDKQDQRRQSYDFLLKAYYDISDSLRAELTYTYAPQMDYRFIVGSKDNYYNFQSGGHQAGAKILWENALGILTNTLNYSYMQNSTITQGFNDWKDWFISDSKNWSNWVGLAREGGYAPYDSTQHTLNNKLIQDFTPFEVGFSTHTLQAGFELSYQYVQNSNPRNYYLSPTNASTYMTQEQQAKCNLTDMQWCDPAQVYDVRTNRLNVATTNGAVTDKKATDGYYLWNYGQYFRNTLFYKEGGVALHNVVVAVFIEDDIKIPLGVFGSLNTRAGLRLDYDTYMEKRTFAPRLSLNYHAPWNEWDSGKDFATQLTFGANRYYGRNIFAYALADGMTKLRTDIRRNDPSITWQETLQQAMANGNFCSGNQDFSNCYLPAYNSTDFTQLNVPYVNEFMVGFMQAFFDLNLGVKYIHRQGRDEVRRACFNSATGVFTSSCPSSAQPNGNSYYTYNNEGRSTTNVLTISLQHNAPLEFLNTRHFMLFSFDWTNVLRNYADYSDTLTNAELANQWISWNGQLIRYRDKPADNFIRPYTLRLTTTHNFSLGRTKWLLNNFFRYRSGYNVMASTPASSTRPTNPPDSFTINGVDTKVDTFRPFKVKGAFTWDMRVGFEVDMYKGNSLYLNLDIYNVLDSKNLAIASASYSTTAGTTATPVYEVGRQFWVQVGYKF